MTKLLEDGFEIKAMAVDRTAPDGANMWIFLQKGGRAALCLSDEIGKVASFWNGAICNFYSKRK